MHFSPQFYACICVVYVCISSICMSACLIYMNRDSTVYSKFVLCSNLFDNAGSLEDPASTLPTNMLFSPMVKAVPKNQKTFSALVPPRSRHFAIGASRESSANAEDKLGIMGFLGVKINCRRRHSNIGGRPIDMDPGDERQATNLGPSDQSIYGTFVARLR